MRRQSRSPRGLLDPVTIAQLGDQAAKSVRDYFSPPPPPPGLDARAVEHNRRLERGERVYYPDGTYYDRTPGGGVTMPIFTKVRNKDGSVQVIDPSDGSVTMDLPGPARKPVAPPATGPCWPPQRRSYDAGPDVVIHDSIAPKLDAIAKEFSRTTGKRLWVTDSFRTPAMQAEQMFRLFGKGKAGLYRNRAARQPILDAYNRGRLSGLSDREIKASMAIVIAGQVDRGVFVSAHLRNGGLDFRTNGLQPDDRAELRKAIARAGGSVLDEKDHYHVQFPAAPRSR